MRFGIRKLGISRRTGWVLCSVAVTMFAVAVLLANALRAPQSPIEAGGPRLSAVGPAAYASNRNVLAR